MKKHLMTFSIFLSLFSPFAIGSLKSFKFKNFSAKSWYKNFVENKVLEHAEHIIAHYARAKSISINKEMVIKIMGKDNWQGFCVLMNVNRQFSKAIQIVTQYDDLCWKSASIKSKSAFSLENELCKERWKERYLTIINELEHKFINDLTQNITFDFSQPTNLILCLNKSFNKLPESKKLLFLTIIESLILTLDIHIAKEKIGLEKWNQFITDYNLKDILKLFFKVIVVDKISINTLYEALKESLSSNKIVLKHNESKFLNKLFSN